MKIVSIAKEDEITFNINRTPHGDRYLYNTDEITLSVKDINIIVGCNGFGKSTLLQEIRQQLVGIKDIRVITSFKKLKDEEYKEDRPQYLYWDLVRDGHQNALSLYGFQGKMNRVVNSITSSEGQNIFRDFVTAYMETIKQAIENIEEHYTESNKIFVLVDGLDSGLDVIRLREFIKGSKLQKENIKKDYGIDLIYILTSNSYELSENNLCIYPYDNTAMRFESYSDYVEFIASTIEMAENRKEAKTDNKKNKKMRNKNRRIKPRKI